uniref:Ig-like domain-containing protein n=1 Tax=Amphiprion ocellaris TaxID=80972 RepID=A0AAQ5ZKV9_AMPOC
VVYLIVVSDVLCVTVAHSQNWDVTYTQLRMCGPKGSAVDMNCSYTYPAEVHGKENIVQTKFWYVGRKEDLQRKSSSYEGRVHYDWHYDSDCTLRITDLRVEDSAVYKFRFITNLDKFSDAPKLPSVSVSPSAEIVEGSSVNLTCNGEANPAATYTWFKVNDRDPLSQTPQLNFSSIRSSESGQYSCTNALGNTSSSIYINVKYAPKFASLSVSPSGEIVEGMNLTCSSDANPAANYTWYKENEEQPLGPGSIYNLASISSEDKGNYCCKSENKHGQSSSFLFISVQCKYSLLYKSLSKPQMLIYMKKYLNICFPDAPKLPSVSGSVSGEGSSVTLTCSSDANPAANYTWYKENEDSPKASGQTFTISDDGHEQSGNYQCKVQNSRGHHSSTLHLVVVQISPEDPGKALYLRLLSFLMCSLHFKPMFTQMLSV